MSRRITRQPVHHAHGLDRITARSTPWATSIRSRGAAVLSRGIVGDRGGRATVQSPIKKQPFALDDGTCLDDSTVAVPVYRTRITADGYVEVGS